MVINTEGGQKQARKEEDTPMFSYLALLGVAPKQEKQAVHTPQGQRPVIQPVESLYRVSFTKTGIEVSALLTDLASADELISTINALKLLLRPAASIKRPEDANDDEASSC